MDKEKPRNTEQSEAQALSQETIRVVKSRTEQHFWQYVQHLRDPEGTKNEFIEQETGVEYSEWLFYQLQDTILLSIKEMPGVLQIPEARRFAEYFGAIPIQASDMQYTRSYEDRYDFESVMLPGEERYTFPCDEDKRT